MPGKSNSFLHIAFAMFISYGSIGQKATVTIENKSNRELMVKVIKGTDKKGVLYKTETIPPKGKKDIHFTETGKYHIKNRSISIPSKTTQVADTLYDRTSVFQIIADSKKGYSKLSMKYTVSKSKKPNPLGALPISRREFEED